jgi:chlorobactene glucosyltransferase
MTHDPVLSLLDCQTVLTVILLVVAFNLVANLRMLARCAPRRAQPQRPELVSVLIPARNEALNIGACLESLLAQDYPHLEILVLDDSSTDATAKIVAGFAARDQRVRLVSGQPLPQGWMGKNYACHQLARLAQGEWLLFTDADTQHQPGTVAWALAAAQQNRADLVSVIPHTVTVTLGEQLIVPIIPFALLGFFPLDLADRLRIPFLTMALGPFMLFSRRAYAAIDGHQGVRGEIAEDVMLARRIRRAGGRVVLLDGSEHVSVRFYRGFGESWHGLAKSAFAALEYRLLPSLAMAGFYGFLFLWPLVLLLIGLWNGRLGELAVRLALFQALLNSGLYYVVAQRFHLPRRTALFYPLTVFLVILILCDSIRRATVTGIAWKERVYRIRDGTLWH